jgi:hypothetical protein
LWYPDHVSRINPGTSIVSKYIRWITLLVLLLLAAPALAQGRVIVDDPTGSINETTVEQAASDLVSKGATVVVLVSENTGSDPQAYVRERLSANRIQANPLDPSAIVYLVALDLRNVFIYYGADWNAKLGPTYKTIADRDMIPQMARGNVTEGIVAGIKGTISAIDNPSGTGSGSDGSSFLAWLIGLPVIGGLILFLWRGFSKRRTAAQALASARESAEQSRHQAGVAITNMGQAPSEARTKAQYDKISYTDLIEHDEQMEGSLSAHARQPIRDAAPAESKALKETAAQREIATVGQRPPEQIDVIALRQLLASHFNIGELQDLCFDLNIDFENLPGQMKSDKARELVAHAQRHGRLADVISQVRRLRPLVAWPTVSRSEANPPENA